MEGTTPGKRKPNFSHEEIVALLAEVKKKQGILFAKFDSSVSQYSKLKAWDQISYTVSAVGTCSREGDEVRKKFHDLRSLVKKKLVLRNREMQKTGEDYCDFPALTPAEEAMASFIRTSGYTARDPKSSNVKEASSDGAEEDMANYPAELQVLLDPAAITGDEQSEEGGAAAAEKQSESPESGNAAAESPSQNAQAEEQPANGNATEHGYCRPKAEKGPRTRSRKVDRSRIKLRSTLATTRTRTFVPYDHEIVASLREIPEALHRIAETLQDIRGTLKTMKQTDGSGPSEKKPSMDAVTAYKMEKFQQIRERQMRAARGRQTILDLGDDSELIKKYRLDRAGIVYLINLLRDTLESPTVRSNPIPPEMKVLVTLQYLATGKMHLCSSSDGLGPSQPSVSRVVTQTLKVLSSPAFLTKFIKFPTDPDEIQKKQEEFVEIAGFPGVVGVIDTTHVRIATPKDFEEEYINSKNFHSINTQIVFDAKYKVLDIVANWPGSTNDVQVLQESGLARMFDRNIVPAGCHLIGDSNYPCKLWLLTPYLRPEAGGEVAYNRAHEKTRRVVERGLAQMKRRFRVLQGEVRVDPKKTCQIILACAALHNMCKDRNIQLPDEHEITEFLQVEETINPHLPAEAAQDGLCFRDLLTNTHFNYEAHPHLVNAHQ